MEGEGGEGEGAGEAGGAEFGPELGGGAVELEDVFGAAVEAGAEMWIRKRGGAGTPAEERAVGTHPRGGGQHGGALDIAEVGRGGGIGAGEHGARARIGDGDEERREREREGEEDFAFAVER